MPNGGIRMVKNACDAYGYKLDPKLKKSLHSIAKPTIRVSLMLIRLKSGEREKPALSPVCLMHMAGAGL
jgi:hypothetical protein